MIYLKADPYANYSELRPNSASVIEDIDGFLWKDDKFVQNPSIFQGNNSPINIYELYLGSFMDGANDDGYPTYRSIAPKLIDYVKKITDSFWVAQFRTSTYSKTMPEPDVIIWRAYLRIKYDAFQDYENIEKDETDKMNYTQNPFGFKVMTYNANYAGKPEKAYTAMETAKKVFENLEDVVK